MLEIVFSAWAMDDAAFTGQEYKNTHEVISRVENKGLTIQSPFLTQQHPKRASEKAYFVAGNLVWGGTQTCSIINGLHFGSNSTQKCPNIYNPLEHLGLREGLSQKPEWGETPSLTRVSGHEDHYPIYLRPPTATAVPIKPAAQQLNAQSVANNISISETYEKGGDDHSANTTPQPLPKWLIKKIEKDNACTFAENQSSTTKLGEPYGLLRPNEYVISAIINAHDDNKKIKLPFGALTATLSVPPAHGKVVVKLRGEEILPGHKTMAGTYTSDELVYVPNPDFYGIDTLQFKVNYNGQIIKVNYQVHVLEQNSNECTEPEGYDPTLMLNDQPETNVTLDNRTGKLVIIHSRSMQAVL